MNVMHPALDKLAGVSLSERWSHPEMLKIRQLGAKAIPPLRQVLREKDKPTTRFLLWVKAKWPGVVKYYSHIPDPMKLTERRWAACQVLQTLGPAGKSAAPELVKVVASKDPDDVNGGAMALWAVGIDPDICEQLDEVLEKGTAEFGRTYIVSALGSIKPPSARTIKVLTAALSDASPHVQRRAVETLGQLGVATPEVISALKHLQSTSKDDLMIVTVSSVLWDLHADPGEVTARIFPLLENQLRAPVSLPLGSGSGGQGVWAEEQVFMGAADLFRKMQLAGSERNKALALLDSFCAKSGRIFIRMLLLPGMLDLGVPREKCVEVCDTGLHQEEAYYRLQAARLLVAVSDKYPVDEIDIDALLKDPEVGVRVYAAKIHWRKKKRANVVVPVLVEALDRNKHQSYYYAEILPAALKALGAVGPEAHGAASAVLAVTHDPNPSIAKLATETLTRIQK